MISGSYWPGDLWLFRGKGGTQFAAGEILKAKDGSNLNAGPKWKNERTPDMDSLASAPWLQDVDGDGDLDLLVGNIAGNVILIENEGDATHFAFGKKSRVQAGGKDLNVARNDAGPTTADWDGDGLWDLIAGCGDGSVWFFKNTGTAKAMQLAAGVELVPANGNQSVRHDQPLTRPTCRSKPHVCDWNGDGQLDLLVGDFASIEMPEPKLTQGQIAKRDELRRQRDTISQELGKLYGRDGGQSDEQKKQAEEVSKRYGKVWEELRPLEAEHKATGSVWVYLRTPPAAPAQPAKDV